MRNAHFEPELDRNTEALIDSICGRSQGEAFDDFGDTEWVTEFIEDFLQG